MNDPTIVRMEIQSSGDREADAIALIGQVFRWLTGSTDVNQQHRVASYVIDRWGP